VFLKDYKEWVKKCMDYKVEDVNPRGRSQRTWRDVVDPDVRNLKIKR